MQDWLSLEYMALERQEQLLEEAARARLLRAADANRGASRSVLARVLCLTKLVRYLVRSPRTNDPLQPITDDYSG